MKTLRIVFTIISAIFIAAVIPLGALLSWLWGAVAAVLAFLFYGLMMLAKMKQEENEQTNEPDTADEPSPEDPSNGKTE